MQTYDVTIQSLAYGGDGLGRLPDGRAVFVPFTLPGETVRLALVEEKRGYARAELLDILAPQAGRIPPRCAHFGQCGGCHYQHMPYPHQLAAKTAILQDQLARISGMTNPPVAAMVPSPLEFAYRNHVQFHLDSQGKLGYTRARSEQCLAIRECYLPEPSLAELWPLLDFEAVAGLERVGLRLGAEDDIQLILESSDLLPPEFSVEGLPISAVHLGPAGTLVLAGSDHVVMTVNGRNFKVSAGAFFQVNTRMAAAMVTHLLDRLPLDASTTLLEVYCGGGLFSAFLAERTGRLVAVEAAPAACEDFVTNLDEFEHVELYEGPAEAILPHLEVRPEVILVDPPRAGIERFALDAIVALPAHILAYISCDPATLARDARRLMAAGYRLVDITPFDLFPQSYHIESISTWEKG